MISIWCEEYSHISYTTDRNVNLYTFPGEKNCHGISGIFLKVHALWEWLFLGIISKGKKNKRCEMVIYVNEFPLHCYFKILLNTCKLSTCPV